MNRSNIANQPLATAAVAFAWALLIGAALQFIFLPVFFPHFHAGNGLAAGGDWVYFHQLALDLATRIQEEGWGIWELRPQGQAPAGIAAALYAWSGIQSPAVMLPLNAILFGLAASELHRLVQRVTGMSWAWVGAIPFIVFPSSLLIYGQIHKDAWSIAGLFITFNAILVVAQPLSRTAVATLCWRVVFGVGLIWVVRPYLVQIALLAFWVGVAVLFLKTLVCDFKRNIAGFMAMAAVAIGGQIAVVKTASYAEREGVAEGQVVAEHGASCFRNRTWDRLACLVGNYRRNIISEHPKAGSLIDASVELRDMSDVLKYAPRGMFIGFGAPFPSEWLAESRRPGGRIMRWAVSAEMLFAYMAYLGLLWGTLVSWKSKRCAELWAIMSAAGAVVFIYVLVTPVVGTLYRLRFAGWHAYIAIGSVFLVHMYFTAARAIGAVRSAQRGAP